jgi:hypothetical protein
MNKDGPNGSLYGTLVKHDQSETKRDTSQGTRQKGESLLCSRSTATGSYRTRDSWSVYATGVPMLQPDPIYLRSRGTHNDPH